MANHDKFCPQGEDGLRTDAYCLCEYFDDVRADLKRTILNNLNKHALHIYSGDGYFIPVSSKKLMEGEKLWD